jgi:RHS repeat-associated protein
VQPILRIYADGAAVANVYTPDELPLRTVLTRGVVRESAYDRAGNRTASAEGLWSMSYDANALNQYTVAGDEFFHDADGNLTGLGYGGVPVTPLVWDAENRLVAVTNGGYAIEHGYDWRHRRMTTTAGTGSSRARHALAYDGWAIVHERVDADRGAGWVRVRDIEYVWGPDLSGTLQGAGGVGGLVAVSIGGQYYLPCFDAMGNVTAYLDETGAEVASFTYSAFGETRTQGGSLRGAFPFRFSTKWHETAVTEFCDYGRRWYWPVYGRWISRDPIEEEGGENLYAFCNNIPIAFIDACGNKPIAVLPDSGENYADNTIYLRQDAPDPRTIRPTFETNSYYQDSRFNDVPFLPLTEGEAKRIGGNVEYIDKEISCVCSSCPSNTKRDNVYMVCTLKWNANIHLNKAWPKKDWRLAYGHEQRHVLGMAHLIDTTIIGKISKIEGVSLGGNLGKCQSSISSVKHHLRYSFEQVFEGHHHSDENMVNGSVVFGYDQEPTKHGLYEPLEGTSEDILNLF